jgi:glycosyltransferase involved in cell wall biosynthesis
MKIRVIHIVPSLAPGGAERVAVSIVCGLDRRRFAPMLISLGEATDDELPTKLRMHDVPQLSLGKSAGFSPVMYPRLRKVFNGFSPDVLHTHLHVVQYSFPAAIVSRKPPAQLHTMHQVAWKEAEGVRRSIQRIAFHHGVLPVVIAREVDASFERTYQMKSGALIPNGIPVDHYSKPEIDRDGWRAREGFSNTDLIFASVAWLRPQKNHGGLLRAFAAGPAKSSEARLVLAGDGPLRPMLEAQAVELGIFDRVHFLGPRRDIPSLLNACDAFVLASAWEGHPLSVMEAMAAGKPVVATAVGGVPELVQTGVHGILVEPNDVPGLAEVMLYLTSQPEIRNRMSQAARDRARREFDVSVMVKAYEKLYEHLVESKHDYAGIVPQPPIWET